MADYDYMLDAERLNSKCKRANGTIIVRMELIRHIAKHKELAWARIAHNTLRDARVAASDPEDLWVLALFERTRELWLMRNERI